MLHARKGGGAFVDEEAISVADSEEPKGNALVTLPGSFGGMYRFEKPMHDKIGEVRVSGSIAYELAMTARGVLQYAVTTGPHLWDVAGGVPIVMEAGGLVMSGRRADRRWSPRAGRHCQHVAVAHGLAMTFAAAPFRRGAHAG